MNNPQPELIPCEFCEKMIYPGRNRKRKHCNTACKQAAYRARKKAQALAVTVDYHRNDNQPQALAVTT